MKKAISVLLALVMCLGMCACGENSGGEKPNAIELTLDNYERYLDVYASAYVKTDYKVHNAAQTGFVIGKSGSSAYNFVTGNFGQYVYGNVSVRGLSQNFNYNDIVIEVEFTGRCNHCDLAEKKDNKLETFTWSDFQFFATCSKVDITGNGTSDGSYKFALPAGRGVPVLSYASNTVRYYTESDFLEYSFRIVSVSGTVTPV